MHVDGILILLVFIVFNMDGSSLVSPMSTGKTGMLRHRLSCAATWSFGHLAVQQARVRLQQGSSAVEAVEKGINMVELDTEDQYYVGLGGYPNINGVMELDAAIMDHEMRYGAVMAMRDIAIPISVARTVMEHCQHNILTGDGALAWALQQGFQAGNILTDSVKQEYLAWKLEQDAKTSTEESHDTIGLICLDQHGHLAAGTSTSGWRFKLAGRVGDSPVIGSGLYCDGNVGAAVATGDGEEIMRICLSFMVVEYIRMGMPVQEACSRSIQRVMELQPKRNELETMHTKLVVGIVAMDKHGHIGGASTLGPNNLHRNEPYFPIACWRDDIVDCNQGDYHILEADQTGASI